MATEIKGRKPERTDLRDPVCGMVVNAQRAVKGLYEGREYYFCSKECREKFDSDPEAFASPEREWRPPSRQGPGRSAVRNADRGPSPPGGGLPGRIRSPSPSEERAFIVNVG
jgi:YHS domain-containing protein